MELKFRCFDHHKKVIRYDLTGFECGRTNQIAGVFLNGEYFPVPLNPIMQFTGLKDKNGTDIYEGDILRTTTLGFKWDYRVSYSVIDACFMLIDSRGDCSNRLSDIWREGVTIIGNIHENPELLN